MFVCFASLTSMSLHFTSLDFSSWILTTDISEPSAQQAHHMELTLKKQPENCLGGECDDERRESRKGEEGRRETRAPVADWVAPFVGAINELPMKRDILVYQSSRFGRIRSTRTDMYVRGWVSAPIGPLRFVRVQAIAH